VPGLAPLLTQLPRGGIAEVSGPRSSGRMAILLHVLAQATSRGEICAVLDTHDQFSPHAAEKPVSRSISLLLQSTAFVAGAFAAPPFKVFHRTVPLASRGRVELHSERGATHVTTWDRNGVDVLAHIDADPDSRDPEERGRCEATTFLFGHENALGFISPQRSRLITKIESG
jgi:recA bacterial DNA recombination protein